jgi:sarcosine oxidase gamma subunit
MNRLQFGENPAFATGCSAATIIDHVAVRLHVMSDDACDAYVPASFIAGLVRFWELAAGKSSC